MLTSAVPHSELEILFIAVKPLLSSSFSHRASNYSMIGVTLYVQSHIHICYSEYSLAVWFFYVIELLLKKIKKKRFKGHREITAFL